MTPKQGWRHKVQRELLLLVLLVSAGVIMALLLSYPDTEIVVGFAYRQEGGEKVPTVLLDFETPNVYQMQDFKSTEEFDRWVTSFVTSRLVADGIPKPGATPRLVRVPDLKMSQPEKLVRLMIPLSGLKRLRSHLFVRAYFLQLWATILLPYFLLVVGRLILWIVRFVRTRSSVSAS